MEMDHEEFNFPVFRGMRHQRGYGLGGIFRKMFRYIMPIIKQHGIPILKSVGESTVKGAANFATDTIAGKNIKESANKRLMETFDELKEKAGMKGSGINKRKLLENFNYTHKKPKLTQKFNHKKKKLTRKKDIFD
jgi:hypothetical protein